MTSRWQHITAVTMMPSLKSVLYGFCVLLPFRVSLGKGLVNSSSFPGVYVSENNSQTE